MRKTIQTLRSTREAVLLKADTPGGLTQVRHTTGQWLLPQLWSTSPSQVAVNGHTYLYVVYQVVNKIMRCLTGVSQSLLAPCSNSLSSLPSISPPSSNSPAPRPCEMACLLGLHVLWNRWVVSNLQHMINWKIIFKFEECIGETKPISMQNIWGWKSNRNKKCCYHESHQGG